MADDADQYDRAADRHPTVFLVDPDALARAERLFGPDRDPLPGRWMDSVFHYTDPEDR